MAQGAAVITKLDCRQPAAKNLQQSSAPVKVQSSYAAQVKKGLPNITKIVSVKPKAGKPSNKTQATKEAPLITKIETVQSKPKQISNITNLVSKRQRTGRTSNKTKATKETPIITKLDGVQSKPNQLQKQSSVHVFAVQPSGKNERASSKPQISAQPRQQG
jgi:hypothetical protein